MKACVLLCLVGALPILQGCNSGAGHAREPVEIKVAGNTVTMPANCPQRAAVTVEPVETEHPVSMPLTGRLVWNDDATARVFTPFAGIVRKLIVEVNQRVTTGMPLAEIQSADFGQAQADARKAGSDFRRAERNLARLRELFEHGAAPRKELESAESDYTSAEAEKERAEGRLAIYGTLTTSTNRDFLLPSPLAGILVEKNVTPGQEVRPDQMLANMPQITAPLFVVTDPSKLWILIDAAEADLPRLRPGQQFFFSSRAFPGQTFTGAVAVVSEFVDPATRSIKVRGEVENPLRQLKAEMFVSVNFPDRSSGGASVPLKAVFLKGTTHYAFVEDQPGQFTRHEVQVGPEQEGRIVVLAGLQAGQRVVTDGCILLQQFLR